MGERLSPTERTLYRVILRAVPAILNAWMGHLKARLEEDEKENPQEIEQQQQS